MTGILKLIGSLSCFKEAKLIDMLLDKCILQSWFPYFQFVLFDSLRPSTIFQLNKDGSSWVEPVLS